MSTHFEIAGVVRQYIASNFLFRDDADGLADSDSLLEGRIIDSMGVLELVTFLEDRFGIRVADDEVVPRNLDTVGGIASYVCRKLQADPAMVAVGHAR